MRSNGNNSKCGTGNCNGSNASVTAVDGGNSRGINGGRSEATEIENWFEPVISDCPGGVCSVPWATPEKNGDPKEKEQTYQKKTWSTYIEKHKEIVDNVNHPSHYNDGGLECIEAIEAQLTPEEYRGYLKGNVAKYVWRERHKGGIESLKKAQWYLTRLINLE
jgi:hypothetical protein